MDSKLDAQGFEPVRVTQELHTYLRTGPTEAEGEVGSTSTRAQSGYTRARFFMEVAYAVDVYEFRGPSRGSCAQEVWYWRAGSAAGEAPGAEEAEPEHEPKDASSSSSTSIDPQLLRGLEIVRKETRRFADAARFAEFKERWKKYDSGAHLSAAHLATFFEEAVGNALPADQWRGADQQRLRETLRDQHSLWA